jgi:hypothetical protein
LGALQVAASRAGKKEVGERAVVNADVSIGRTQVVPGLGLKVVLRVEGVEDQAILDAAHEVRYTVIVTTTETDVVDRCVHTVALCARVLRSTLRRPERGGVIIMMGQGAATSDPVQVLVMNVSVFANKT